MKRVARSVLIGAAVLVASSLFAQVPHLTPFSADMQRSSMQANPVNRDLSGKLNVSPQAMRMDMNGEGGRVVNIITTFATQTVDIIMPGQRIYMEYRAGEGAMHGGADTSDVHPYDPKNPCASDPGSTCKDLGAETISGRSTEHWQVTHKDGNISEVWIDNSLHFPIKAVSSGTIWQLTNIKEGPQEPSLFQVPAGYRKMDITGIGATGAGH